jgi:hypothetical protein
MRLFLVAVATVGLFSSSAAFAQTDGHYRGVRPD